MRPINHLDSKNCYILGLAARCESPKGTSSSYSTNDAFFHFQVSRFSCWNFQIKPNLGNHSAEFHWEQHKNYILIRFTSEVLIIYFQSTIITDFTLACSNGAKVFIYSILFLIYKLGCFSTQNLLKSHKINPVRTKVIPSRTSPSTPSPTARSSSLPPLRRPASTRYTVVRFCQVSDLPFS